MSRIPLGRIQSTGKAGNHMRSWKLVTSSGLVLVLAGALCVPVVAQQASAGPQAGPPAGPPVGMLNYVDGQASLGGRALSQSSVGSAQWQAGQTLETQSGRAEVLLNPGVLMRIDNNSAVLMNTAGLADTAVAVQGGRAMVEADQVRPENHIDIQEGPATVRLVTNGLYDFDAAHGIVRVFDGRAEVT